MSAFRALGRDFVAYGLMGGISRSVHILLLPILTRQLSTEEYGIVDIVATMTSVLTLTMALTLESAVARSWFESEEEEKRQDLVSSVTLFILFWGSIIVFLTWHQADAVAVRLLDHPQSASYMLTGAVAALLAALGHMPQIVLRMQRRIAHYTIVTLIQTVVFAGLAIFFIVGFETGVAGVFVAQVCANALALIVGMAAIRRHLGGYGSWRSLRSALSFSLPLFPAVVVTSVNRHADRVILVLFLGLAPVGVFAAAARIALIMNLLIDVSRQAWLPFSMALLDHERGRAEIYRRGLNYYAGCMASVGLIISAYSREVMALFVPQEYLSGYVVIPWLMLAQILNGSGQFTNLGMLISKKTSRISVAAWAGAVVNIGLGLLLIPHIGIWGAAIGSAVAGLILTTLLYRFSLEVADLAFDIGKMTGVLLCYVLVCTGFIVIYESVAAPMQSFVLRSMLLVASVCAVMGLTVDAPALRAARSALSLRGVER